MREFLIALLILILPIFVQSGAIEFTPPSKSPTLQKFIENLLNFLFTISLSLGTLIIVIAAILLVTAGGDPQQAERAKKIIIYTLIALVIILMSKGLIALIRDYILK
jgi:hypothetical protein